MNSRDLIQFPHFINKETKALRETLLAHRHSQSMAEPKLKPRSPVCYPQCCPLRPNCFIITKHCRKGSQGAAEPMGQNQGTIPRMRNRDKSGPNGFSFQKQSKINVQRWEQEERSRQIHTIALTIVLIKFSSVI